MAHFGELSAAQVWDAATRTLTAFGTLPADVWAAATRTLTAFDARALFALPLMPSYYPAVGVSANASADTFGDWAQVSADVGTSRRLIGAFIVADSSQDMSVEVEFGEGAAGAEAAVARVTLFHEVGTDVGKGFGSFYPLWRALTDNARLSVRARCSFAAAFPVRVASMVA